MPKKSNSFHVWRQCSRKLFVGVFGFCLAIFGILCGMFWLDIFNSIVIKELTLRPNSKLYENWKTPPIPISLDIYLFNWTNPEDFNNLTTKPILEQLGPYRFTEKPDKVDIVWHPENASVTYRKKSLFYFDEEGSNGSLDDVVITLNPVALTAAAKAKKWESLRRRMANAGLQMYGQEMSVMKTVDELLFTGYSDDLIDVAKTMEIFGDVKVPFDRFGWFYTRNGSADLTGVFNVYTGADDISKVGQMHSWNHNTHTGYFEGHCGFTNGSAGELQPPNLQVNGSVSLFTPDICRTVTLDYEETTEIEELIGYKYTGGPKSVDNGTEYPENACFCGGECVPSGLMNVTACRFGSPVFMSYPHFYNADPVYVNQVEGLSPNKEDHEFYMILEPNTGVALEVAVRFQVNMLVEPIEGMNLYSNIPRIFFPLIWFGVKVRITPELAGELKVLPIIAKSGQIVACVCFAIGLIMLSWYPVVHIWSKTRETQPAKRAPTHVEEKPLRDDQKLSRAIADHSPLLDKALQSKMPQIIVAKVE